LLAIHTAEEAAAHLRDLIAVDKPPDAPAIQEPKVCTQC
jgi:hypothetical protein